MTSASTTHAEHMPLTVEELTTDWFDAAIRQRHPERTVTAARVDDVMWGTATKVMATLEIGGGVATEQVCVKGGFDPAMAQFGAVVAYEREVQFFGRIAPDLELPLPRCWYAGANLDEGQALVVLDDLNAAGAVFTDCAHAWSPDLVAQALEVLARLHGQTAGGRDRYPWLPLSSPVRPVSEALFAADYWSGLFTGDQALMVPEPFLDRERMQAALHALWRHNDTRADTDAGVCHGDAHLGNTYRDSDGHPAFVDWQCVHIGPPLHDVAYFISGALSIADRRTHERDLLHGYLAQLAAHGGPDLSPDNAWVDYRRETFYGYIWALTSPHMQERHRIVAMTDRHLAAIEDHDSITLALGADPHA